MTEMDGNGGAPADKATQLSPTFQIVLICTGNRFRSALAEGFLRKLGTGLPLELRSLGTRDAGPAPPLLEAFELATKHGLDLTRHRARSLGGNSSPAPIWCSDSSAVTSRQRSSMRVRPVNPASRCPSLPSCCGRSRPRLISGLLQAHAKSSCARTSSVVLSTG